MRKYENILIMFKLHIVNYKQVMTWSIPLIVKTSFPYNCRSELYSHICPPLNANKLDNYDLIPLTCWVITTVLFDNWEKRYVISLSRYWNNVKLGFYMCLILKCRIWQLKRRKLLSQRSKENCGVTAGVLLQYCQPWLSSTKLEDTRCPQYSRSEW